MKTPFPIYTGPVENGRAPNKNSRPRLFLEVGKKTRFDKELRDYA